MLLRLRRIEGQVRGIQRMVEENRDCRDVVVQLAAVKASIASLNTLVAETYAQECLCGGEQLDTPRSAGARSTQGSTVTSATSVFYAGSGYRRYWPDDDHMRMVSRRRR